MRLCIYEKNYVLHAVKNVGKQMFYIVGRAHKKKRENAAKRTLQNARIKQREKHRPKPGPASVLKPKPKPKAAGAARRLLGHCPCHLACSAIRGLQPELNPFMQRDSLHAHTPKHT